MHQLNLRKVLGIGLALILIVTSAPLSVKAAWQTEEVPVFVFEEESVPESFTTDEGSHLSISELRFKRI